ncbi:hypothetical protein ONS95_014913 [Cadophora gregata]|uniref:uncharacterized protein n=1 Tax=Cadophora gregata TaxID=51156 RepID=UPI0026DDC3E2|nr:uncharacterized protein ONS95_014913 [Cadophora gregata]KAK0113218.1 hypothetical protein ONS95_014913 [Cadophora gregata]KAK0125260.1 hypothetical protein ONS96_009115 [Cadophora gregata f. sp. sojae]
MASEPTTPVRVPKAASTYTPTTQDADLRSQINSVLLRDGHITKIHDTLLHTLHSHPQNWPTLLQNHALSLLRSGTCTTFPDLMTRVLQDIKDDTEASAAHQQAQSQINSSSSSTTAGSQSSSLLKGKSNGVTTTTGSNGKFGKKKGEDGGMFVGKGEGGQSLALPRSVVEEGVKITRECLEAVCEVDE